ncbi:hypothetical protein Ana3638_08045 [Anaerocolumna sedimenticola]|uniref:DUF218 domain-containing protein n=1 Tax=Anaerocolumna sedimenticola TaxID=2696063 RepID=A0A6P1TKU5_9FIRM|nr:YdcF family protein [Anaerocolumna sedimenticola]QHQ60732.1 hypothetical protein Ana3638_08045 [Anaerocolumna sedimenticola]
MNLLAVIFLIIGLFSIGYTIAIVCYSGINTAFLGFWIIMGLGCIVLSLVLRFLYTHNIEGPKYLKFIFTFLFLSGISIFLLVEAVVIQAGNKQPQPGADYVIVLGAQVRGTALSRALKNRLDTAYEYLVNNTTAKVIVSGGQGNGEDISEAEAMKEYLVGKGIQDERILMEDKSTNTHENLLLSKVLMTGEEHNTVIVTSRFHVFRAVGIAGKLGLTNVSGLGAPTNDILIVSYYVREFFAIIKDKLVGNI